MKLSSILTFATLGVTATLAFPLSPRGSMHDLRGVERRRVQPARRDDASATATPTDSTTVAPTDSSTISTTASATAAPSSTSSVDSTDTYLYSTITNTDSLSYSANTQTLAPSTAYATTTTETDYPQSTGYSGSGQQNVDISETTIIRVKEFIQVTQVLIVEKPVFIAVEVNTIVRQTIIVNQFTNVFVSRFDNWDISVVEQLSLVISQQYDVLSRSGNHGFQGLDNNVFNSFVEKFISQFEVFQTFQLVDVEQFVSIMQGFDINQLATFFGRSDVLFSQATFEQFSINDSFTIFVQQLTTIVSSISSSAYDSDGIFNLGSEPLLNAGLSIGSI